MTPPVDGAAPDSGTPPEDGGGGDGGSGDPRIDQAVAAVQAALDEGEIPGAALAILEAGHEPVYVGLGVRDLDEGGEVGPHTLFRVASMSKLVLAATILSLVEDGTLSLDDRVVDVLSDLRIAGDFDPTSMTLRNALTHTAGLQDISPVFCPEASALDWIAGHQDVELWAPPGEVWSYSNTGFTVAAAMAEAATGRSFPELVQERVFGPLGMDDSTYDAALAATREHASGTDVGPSAVLGIDDLSCPALDGSGGLITSASDYASFLAALLGPEPSLLSASSRELITSSAVREGPVPWRLYGLGVVVEDPPGLRQRVLLHDGDLQGYRAGFVVLPGEGRIVVLLTNGNPFDPIGACFGALEALRGEAYSPPPAVPPTAEERARIAGHYVDPFGHLGDVTIEVVGDEVHATIPGVGFDGTLTPGYRGWLAGALVMTFQPVEGPSEWLVSRTGFAQRAP